MGSLFGVSLAVGEMDVYGPLGVAACWSFGPKVGIPNWTVLGRRRLNSAHPTSKSIWAAPFACLAWRPYMAEQKMPRVGSSASSSDKRILADRMPYSIVQFRFVSLAFFLRWMESYRWAVGMEKNCKSDCGWSSWLRRSSVPWIQSVSSSSWSTSASGPVSPCPTPPLGGFWLADETMRDATRATCPMLCEDPRSVG